MLVHPVMNHTCRKEMLTTLWGLWYRYVINNMHFIKRAVFSLCQFLLIDSFRHCMSAKFRRTALCGHSIPLSHEYCALLHRQTQHSGMHECSYQTNYDRHFTERLPASIEMSLVYAYWKNRLQDSLAKTKEHHLNMNIRQMKIKLITYNKMLRYM